jgi:hypothetical protein
MKAMVCPSGESMAWLIGLCQWLICWTVAGPFAWRLKKKW